MTIETPQNARSRRTRKALQNAALDLLHDGGVGAVTMEAVACRAGYSRRAVYLHFGSRSELFVSLIDFVNEREGIDKSRQVVLDAQGPVERLMATGHFLADYHVKIAHILLAIDRDRDSDEAAREAWADSQRRWRRGCISVIAELRQASLLHSRWETDDDAVDMMWSLYSIDVLKRLVHDCQWPPKKYGRYLGELFVEMFAQPPLD